MTVGQFIQTNYTTQTGTAAPTSAAAWVGAPRENDRVAKAARLVRGRLAKLIAEITSGGINLVSNGRAQRFFGDRELVTGL